MTGDSDGTGDDQPNPLTREDAAVLIKALRMNDDVHSAAKATEDIVGALWRFSEDADMSEYDVTREEANQILATVDTLVTDERFDEYRES